MIQEITKRVVSLKKREMNHELGIIKKLIQKTSCGDPHIDLMCFGSTIWIVVLMLFTFVSIRSL